MQTTASPIDLPSSTYTQVFPCKTDQVSCLLAINVNWDWGCRSESSSNKLSVHADEIPKQEYSLVSSFSSTRMCEPTDLSTWREVFVLIFYPRDRTMAYRNAAVREKAVIRNYTGANIGYTEQIQKVEGDWDDRVCVGVMKFSNPTLTRRWLESDHPFRQPDFLGQVDIILVPLQKNDMSHKGYPIIEITSLHVSFKDLYETKYLPELECLVQRFGGVPLVVCQNEPWKWRAVENPGAISINQWPNWDSYEQYCAREETRKLDELRKTIGNGYHITAELLIDM